MLSPQRENSNAIFASDELQNSNNLVNAVAIFDNITINDVVYELNAATVSDSQVEFARDSNGINHTNNGINHQKILSRRTIGIRHEEVAVLPHPMKLRIGAIVLAPQKLKLPAAQ